MHTKAINIILMIALAASLFLGLFRNDSKYDALLDKYNDLLQQAQSRQTQIENLVPGIKTDMLVCGQIGWNMALNPTNTPEDMTNAIADVMRQDLPYTNPQAPPPWRQNN
jgi:hypothetical protein